MARDAQPVIWMNGKLVAFEDAKIHVLSHVVHYGSCLFEGVRAYDTPKGTAIFRLRDHTRRLYNSCKIYRMTVPYTQDAFNAAIVDTVKANGFKACYVRPLVYRGYGSLGVDPFPNLLELAITVAAHACCVSNSPMLATSASTAACGTAL